MKYSLKISRKPLFVPILKKKMLGMAEPVDQKWRIREWRRHSARPLMKFLDLCEESTKMRIRKIVLKYVWKFDLK